MLFQLNNHIYYIMNIYYKYKLPNYMIEFTDENICCEIAWLKYGIENSLCNKLTICNEIAVNGDLECLIFARQNGCLITEQTLVIAAENTHYRCFKFIHQCGIEIPDDLYKVAIENHDMDILLYIMMISSKWKRNTKIELTLGDLQDTIGNHYHIDDDDNDY